MSAGVPESNVFVLEDGMAGDLTAGEATVGGAVPCGYVYVDGSNVGGLAEASLTDRRILGEEGFISIVVVVDSVTGKVTGGPEVHARGFAEDDSVFDDILPEIVQAIEKTAASGNADSYQLQQTIRRTIGRWVGGRLKRRPMIIPVVVES